MAPAASSPVDRTKQLPKHPSNSYTLEQWFRHRPLITQLYFEEDRTLKEVAEYLRQEYDFAPTERMYKSRIHAWDLIKKKKEHEMLDLVRKGLRQKSDDKDKAFLIRGRQITLDDALRYFKRKGIKDPSSLLEPQRAVSGELSSPDDGSLRTPLSPNGIFNSTPDASDLEMIRIATGLDEQEIPSISLRYGASEFASERLNILQQALKIPELPVWPPFRTLFVESSIAQTEVSAEDQSYQDVIFQNMQTHFTNLFTARNLSVRNTTGNRTAASADVLADQFYYSMYYGYFFLFNDQRGRAFDNFYNAFALIKSLLKDDHVGFMIYILDLTIRHDGAGYEEPLLMLLQHLVNVAKIAFESEEHPIHVVATNMHNATASRAWLAESTLRRLLGFFQDSIGYFRPETIALLETLASVLLDRARYAEAAVRFQQLVDAFETTVGNRSYEVCYALGSASEAYFHMGQYIPSLQAIKASLERSQTLLRPEEREIYVRCLRGMAEIKLGRKDEAVETMQHVVGICQDAFGPEHTFTSRAKMHLESILKGDARSDCTIPPMLYRPGCGGNVSKNIWTPRSSSTRLQA